MTNIVQDVGDDDQITFVRSQIFYKIIAACNLARLHHKTLWFVHNGITVKVGHDSKPDLLFCAWLDAQRTGVTEIGPVVDELIIERLVQLLRGMV